MGGMTEQPETSRTAILTVDDDPGVSRAVARDLRRRYGQRYRVVRAESGADALEALRQMKLRGDLVAAILADYRMPEMNGIEFLERAMDIYPGARRVLLTAYADTGAAIDAMSDHHRFDLVAWSKVAIRCSGGTNFGLALSVVTRMNSTSAFLAAPSFQEGSGSLS